MALQLHIPSCIRSPVHAHHPPPPDKPLRIQIEGPLPSGPLLAKLAYRTIYGSDPSPGIENDIVVRDEYLGWIRETIDQIDYYGVTFDHLVPHDDTDPEVLQINIIEMDGDGGEYANACLPFAVDWKEFTSKRILAVPRCCQIRKGTTGRLRINEGVRIRDEEAKGEAALIASDEESLSTGKMGSQITEERLPDERSCRTNYRVSGLPFLPQKK
ncbi:hypothetical protein T069G_00390 [Trichoderma breve]|uniref:Uncharacterized protein n=1 Tax=Trichoderma breve TaxID=2034170 RepID=A0A9W9EBX0_9HYPO|nr:hypothetical protein T069G_00390 [Trichoderma breve]KAJ4863860.1 hypothetical protein T069G_00390 [Trichoderma breve]